MQCGVEAGRTDNGVPEARALKKHQSFRKYSSLVVFVENIFPNPSSIKDKLRFLQKKYETTNQPTRDQPSVRLRDVAERADADGDIGENDGCKPVGAAQQKAAHQV